MKIRSMLRVLCGVSAAAVLFVSCDQAPKSDTKAITAFSIVAPEGPGIISDSGSAKTITVQVPRATDLKSLVAKFTTTGSKVSVGSVTQTSAVTPNDFTNPVTYTVTAEDGTTENYKVTVSLYKRCMFFGISDVLTPGDSLLVVKLRSLKYDITVKAPIAMGTWPADSFALFDFAFLSESPNSSSYAFLKGHPIPILNLEAWASDKTTVLNWGKGGTVSNFEAKVCVITGTTGHSLTAGLPNGKEFRLVDSSLVANEAAIAFEPAINVIPIAALKDSLTMVCACAVEKGTLLADSLTTTQNRAVTIGIHESAYDFITPEAYQLIQAGIRWILGQSESPVPTAEK